MSAREVVVFNLAAAFLAGPWSVEEILDRAALAWGRRERWLRPLAQRAVQAFGAGPRFPEETTLAAWIGADPSFQGAWSNYRRRQDLPLRQIFWVKGVMAPAAGAPASWALPALTSPGQLADWLGLEPAALDWLADCQGRAGRAASGPLGHYTYRWLVTRRKARLLEVPRARLRAVQRRLLHEVLDRMPPHQAAHGYRRGRSVASYVAPHAGRHVVLHMDLKQFFPSVRASRVHAIFRTAGYPRAVARLLTGLCTNTVPVDVLSAGAADTGHRPDGGGREFLAPHLPQGAPTSPALANLAAYRLDCRLEGLSRSAGATYTRYADDLVFSGEEGLERCLRRFHVCVCRVALEEGFEVNTRKSHFMRQGVRQQVAGVVLNALPNIRRREFDRLKAILTNCWRLGPEGQNRDGHPDFRAYLAGRIAYLAMIHPARGQRLRALFERICWQANDAAPPGE